MLPQPFLERMQGLLGSEYEEFLASFEHEKYQALRLNPLKIENSGRQNVDKNVRDADTDDAYSVSDTIEEKLHQTFRLEPVTWAENGYYYEKEDQPGKHPWHEAGLYYIQEPSAMAPVTLLSPQPGEKILDLCAAPGGKSTQIAAAMQGEGLLITNEIHPARAKILSENVERMGIRNACVLNETPEHLADIFERYFDRILVDAPCSGEGMFRKNEAAGEEWSPENVQLCADRQDNILECAARMLIPGGRLVYSTCTFAPAENEGSISRFLAKHPEFVILPIDKKALGIPEGCDGIPGWVEDPAVGIEGTLRLWPHKLKGEGHYAAVLQKKGELSEGYRTVCATGVEKGIPAKNRAKDLAEYITFVSETLTDKCVDKLQIGNASDRFLTFGENLYRMPEDLPSVKGLKVMRPGLHLGTLKKNRFEPAHALALSLHPEDVKHVWNLSVEEASAYLKGQTFSAEGEKGWYLICVDDISLGWGKLAGGIMKNHYPKGLRK